MAAYYETADLVRQATLLIIGLSQNQPFTSGNKRTAFAAGDAFLRLNGYAFSGDSLELAERLAAVAPRTKALETTTQEFEDWLRKNIEPL